MAQVSGSVNGTPVLFGGVDAAGAGAAAAAAAGSNAPPTTYYVDNVGGSDSNPGTLAQPFATIAKINGLTLTAGQTVAFKSGDTWHEMLTVGQSGAVNSPITYTSYGGSTLPIIDAANVSLASATWTQGTGVAAQETCTGSCVFASGFESTSFSDWTSVTQGTNLTASVSTVQKNHGTSSMAITSGASPSGSAYVVKSLTALASGGHFNVRFYLYGASGAFPASSTVVIGVFQTGGSGVGNISVVTNASGNPTNFNAYGYSPGANLTPYNPGVGGYTVGAWNEVEMDITLGSAGASSTYVNGSQIGGSTYTANTTSLVGVNSFEFGGVNGPAANQSIYFDDFQIASGSSPIGNFSGSGLPVTVWSTPLATNPIFPSFNGQMGIQETSAAAVVAPNEWYWDGSSTFYGYGLSSPADQVIEFPTRTSGITSAGQSYVTLSNLEVRGGSGAGIYCGSAVACNYWTMNGVVSDLNFSSGAQFLTNNGISSNFGSVLNSRFHHNAASGFLLADNGSSSNWLFDGDTFDHNSQLYATTNYQQYSGGLYFYSLAHTGGIGTVIQNSISHDNGVAGLSGSVGVGFWTDTTIGVVLRGLVSYSNSSNGYFLEKTANESLTYSLGYNNAAGQYDSCIGVSGGQGWISSANTIANNTCWGGYWAASMQMENTNGAINNNVWRANIFGGASAEALYVDANSSNQGTYSTGNTFRFNNFGAASSGFICWGGACQNTNAAFDTAYGSSSNSIVGDPVFVGTAAQNYSLLPSSPALGIGAFPLPLVAPSAPAYSPQFGTRAPF